MFDHDWQGNTPSQVAPDCPPQLTGSVHLGQSSTGVFIRELQNTITRPNPQTTRSVTLEDLAPHTPIGDRISADYVLPRRHTADELLKVYRAVHYPVYPAINWTEMLREIDALYAGIQSSDKCRMTLCLANLMFALAERSKLRDLPSDAGRGYFERAKRLLRFDIFGDISFQVIQALILCAQYLQSAEKPRQCWVIVGLAIRAAQSIGLHIPEAIKNLQPERDQRLAAVVWNCLVTIDRTLSMTLGRSPTLSLSAARAIAITDCITQDNQESDDPPLFFVYSYQLFDILHEILVSLYMEGPKVAPAIDILSHTSRLEKELDRWTRRLPEQLSLQDDRPIMTQAHFLRQRYLQVRMILLRPGLSAIIKTPSTDGWDLEEATTWYCATRCIEAAMEMADIAILQFQADANGTAVAPWWYNMQFCYNAGASLLAARLCSKTADRIGPQHLDEGIGNCVRTLRSYSPLCPTASRCLCAFSSVADKAGCVLPCMLADVTEGQLGFDPVNLSNFEGFPIEDYWSLNWTSSSSTIFDQFGLLDELG